MGVISLKRWREYLDCGRIPISIHAQLCLGLLLSPTPAGTVVRYESPCTQRECDKASGRYLNELWHGAAPCTIVEGCSVAVELVDSSGTPLSIANVAGCALQTRCAHCVVLVLLVPCFPLHRF